jgi:hypothetical protein
LRALVTSRLDGLMREFSIAAEAIERSGTIGSPATGNSGNSIDPGGSATYESPCLVLSTVNLLIGGLLIGGHEL